MKKAVLAKSRVVVVKAVPIELSQLVKFAGLAGTGGEAKQAIVDGKVLVNGAVETHKGKKLVAGDTVAFGGEVVTVQVG